MRNSADCRICSSGKTSRVKFTVQGQELYKCSTCSVLFLHPQPDLQTLEEHYSREYYHAWGEKIGNTETIRKLKAGSFKRIFNILPELPQHSRMLDVGCAMGYTMEAAEACGMDSWGVEISEWASGIAEKKFGAGKIFKGKFEESSFDSGFFDMILMSDFLEHVHDPLQAIKKSMNLLKPGGLLVVNTPDTGSLSFKILGQRWPHFKLEHLFYFNQKSLMKLTVPNGFGSLLFRKTKKAMNLAYLSSQFSIYPFPIITVVLKFFHWVLPRAIAHKIFYLPSGEISAVFRKII